MDDRTLPPIDCDECGRGFHPSGVFKKKDGKNICVWCIVKTIMKHKPKDPVAFLRKLLTDEEFERFLLEHSTLYDSDINIYTCD